MEGFTFKDGVIEINRDLTQLDLVVKDFLDVISSHTEYLIVSGFISISSGRTRGTEDVDILVPVIDKDSFSILFNDLISNGFWCYQGDTFEEVYQYIRNKQSIRFARVDEVFPNMELIFIDSSKPLQQFEFNHPQKYKIGDFEFLGPELEFEICYKELILSGKKDLEDAAFLRTFYVSILDEQKIEKYQLLIKEDGR